MREEEIMQITPALWGWYTYGQDEQDWDSLVCDRVEASGLDGIFLMADIIRDWEATGDWDSYPGPEYGVRSTGFSPVCGLLGGEGSP